jgi:hypothetical protein
MTKKEDIWICSECGQECGRHDMYFDGICEECFTHKLTEEEEEKLSVFISNFKREMGLHKISGGFVVVKSVFVSDYEVELLIRYGAQDEEGGYGQNMSITLDRETFKEI